MKVMIVVTHLLGIGHLTRAAALARAFAAAGHAVRLVSGGRFAHNIEFGDVELLQLPSVHVVGTDFRTLYQPDGVPVDAEYLKDRARRLLDAYARFRPDALIVELYPFGRRQLRSEFDQLLDAAGADNCVIFSSIRDVLNPVTDERKIARTEVLLSRYFDGVLVHSDATILPLDASYPVSKPLEKLLHYTGYVSETKDTKPISVHHKNGEVVVSGGGSAAGLALAEVAVATARGDGRNWRILVGQGVPEQEFSMLSTSAPTNAIVERARPDFRALLGRAGCSVSQFGYNTAMDLAEAGVPAVVVPFDAGNEQEQTIRARRFAELGLVTLLPARELDPDHLRAAVDAAIVAGAGDRTPLAMQGATKTVEITLEGLARRAGEELAWARLAAALDRSASSGAKVRFWWRDDDATAPSPQLERLLELSRRYAVPLALAVIPRWTSEALAARLASEPDVAVLTHGVAHENRAASGQKKQELIAADAATMQGLRDGAHRLAQMFGAQALPVLTPPWNRIAPDLIDNLSALGFSGWTGFANTIGRHDRGHVPTHLDPIDWKAGGGQVRVAPFLERCIALVQQQAEAPDREPIGLLTHHLVHDEKLWRLLERLLKTLSAHPAVSFQQPKRVFGLT